MWLSRNVRLGGKIEKRGRGGGREKESNIRASAKWPQVIPGVTPDIRNRKVKAETMVLKKVPNLKIHECREMKEGGEHTPDEAYIPE